MNEITQKPCNKSVSCEIKCSLNSFYEHILSISESILKTADNSFCEDYEISPLVQQFCQDESKFYCLFLQFLRSLSMKLVRICHIKRTRSRWDQTTSIQICLLSLTLWNRWLMFTTYGFNEIPFFPLWEQPWLSTYLKPQISLTLITLGQYLLSILKKNLFKDIFISI